MTSENSFRIALVVVIILSMSTAAYHRLRAAASGERISHKDEGYLFAAILRLAGLGLWISVLGYLVSPSTFQWASLPLAPLVRWFGFAMGLGSSILLFWTLKSLGKNLTDTVVTRAAATLVTNGPYRWVRHPFYVTTALLIASVTLLTANWLIGMSGLLVFLLLAIRTRKEEQRLIDRFGQQYRDYMAATGRFVPRMF